MLIISLIENLLIEELGNYFRGIFGKMRLKCFTKRLKNEIEYSVLQQYGNEIYYLDFDQFLIEQDVLNKIIKNFLNQDILQSKTINQSVDFYIKLFIEKYPKYKLYNSKIKQILQKYFEIIFRQLNKIGTPESQALCRTIREIIDGIDRQLQHITSIVDDNNTMILELGSIIAALEIIKIVNNEWHDRVVKSSIRYDIIRNVTYESLFYRVVFGITKIFDIREKNGIFKILSRLRHSTKDRSLLSILSTIQEGIDKEQKNIDEIKLLRDKLLAHLDKEMVFSTERLDIDILYYYFEAIEIKSIYTACIELYNTLYGDNQQQVELPKREIILKRFFLEE